MSPPTTVVIRRMEPAMRQTSGSASPARAITVTPTTNAEEMALAGLTDPLVGLIAGSILLISTVVGGDMQQDRSTGWRLGTNRAIQFRYQVIGILMGAVFAVVITKLFLAAYPVLKIDTFIHPELKAGNWQSAMTYKFAGVLRGLASAETTTLKLMGLGDRKSTRLNSSH